MITINIVCVGHLKEKFWKDACEEYQKRLSRFCKLKIIELADIGGEEVEQVLEKERRALEKYIDADSFLLAVEGKEYSSEQFAVLLEKQTLTRSELTFVIGSSYGVSDKIKQKINNKISFGRATYPHNLARVVLLEQIYRAFMINNGTSYHK